MKTQVFLCRTNSPRDFSTLLALAREKFKLADLGVQQKRRIYLDTFDWRLFRAGFVLEADVGRECTLGSRRIGQRSECSEMRVPAMPESRRPLDRDLLPREILALVAGRAVLSRAVVTVRCHSYRISDSNGKTRAYLDTEQLLPAEAGGQRQARHAWVRIRTLHGYAKTGTRLLRAFPACSGEGAADDPFFDATRMLAVHPGDYSLKRQLNPDPQRMAAPEVARLLLEMLDVMERNMAGIRSDLDTEFLHDFRIACRRSRSLISQMQGIFPPRRLRHFKAAFAWLSRQTSAQRDLDVFLAHLPGYRQRLSAAHARALQPLQFLLEEHRRQAHIDLRKTLASPRLRRFRRNWRSFLQRSVRSPEAAPFAERPVIDVSSSALRRIFRLLMRQRSAVSGCAYSEGLHELRKTGKKMRYLLESCAPLYPGKDTARLIRRLKRFQNDLGAIVDCHVQRDCILHWRAELEENPDTGAATLNALDALLHLLELDERLAQERFASQIRRFEGKSTARRMQNMVGGPL